MSDMYVEMDCPQCGAKIGSSALECPYCNRKLREIESRFIHKEHKVKKDWLEMSLPYVAVLWALALGFSGALIPTFGGPLMIAATAVSVGVLFRAEMMFTAFKYVMAIVILRSVAVLIAARSELNPGLVSILIVVIILSVWFGLAIHDADD